MRSTLSLLAVAAATQLAACSTPPKPPKAIEATRQNANDPEHIEALRKRAEAQRERLETALQARMAAASRLLAEAEALGLRPVAVRASFDGKATAAVVYSVRFPVGGSRLFLSPAQQRALVGVAKEAALVELRGRTDALRDNPVDAALARQRALAARTLLLQAGIPDERIRTTWQTWGDHVAPNDTGAGRAQNRRVEIVVHRLAPEAATLDDAADVAQR